MAHSLWVVGVCDGMEWTYPYHPETWWVYSGIYFRKTLSHGLQYLDAMPLWVRPTTKLILDLFILIIKNSNKNIRGWNHWKNKNILAGPKKRCIAMTLLLTHLSSDWGWMVLVSDSPLPPPLRPFSRATSASVSPSRSVTESSWRRWSSGVEGSGGSGVVRPTPPWIGITLQRGIDPGHEDFNFEWMLFKKWENAAHSYSNLKCLDDFFFMSYLSFCFRFLNSLLCSSLWIIFSFPPPLCYPPLCYPLIHAF